MCFHIMWCLHRNASFCCAENNLQLYVCWLSACVVAAGAAGAPLRAGAAAVIMQMFALCAGWRVVESDTRSHPWRFLDS